MAGKPLRVGLVQQACGDDRAANIAASEAGIREAAARGAELVLLQELHVSRYFCQHESTTLFDLAEPIPGPATTHFGALAAKLGIVLVISLFERRAAGLYHNTAVVLERDGRIAGCYRKMHIPDDPATTRSSTSRPAIWVSHRSTPASAGSACWCAGISGTRKAPA
jgi:Predicted amidohydrolase